MALRLGRGFLIIACLLALAGVHVLAAFRLAAARVLAASRPAGSVAAGRVGAVCRRARP
jgi:hypothetical protein